MIVQGYVVQVTDRPAVAMPPDNEAQVRMSRDVLLQMAAQLRDSDPPQRGRLLDDLHTYAFRLEAQPAYEVGDPRWEAFRRGDQLQPRTEMSSPWLRRIAESRRQGVLWERVHVVGELTEYQRYELMELQDNVAAGEDVRVGDLGRHPELAALREDFWLLDDGDPHARALLMRYSPLGEFLGAWRATDAAALRECQRQRDLALSLSEPLENYLIRTGLKRRAPA